MALFTRSLWPETVRHPYRRLAMGFIFAPLMLGVLLAVLTFMVGGVSEPDQGAVIDYTIRVMPYLLGALIAFTLTFGVAGVGVLWALGQRSMVIWALLGATLGATAGSIVTVFGTINPPWIVPAAFGFLGWLLFLLIRAVAGVRAPVRLKIEL
ncbi:MAG: hypothetical protein AAF409_11405 [Pseudomonadota bacterium]